MSTQHHFSFRLVVSALLFVGSGLFVEAKAEEAEPSPFKESASTFESGGKSIRIERFEPAAEGELPAVIILHGAGGMQIGGEAFRDVARRMARQGYVAHLVRYFDRTETRSADLEAMRQHFETWMDTIADAIDHAAAQPNVDGDRIGLIGFSLGSYLALSESARNPKIKAVAEYFGGLPEVLLSEVDRLPPILILHGNADPIVPISEARALEKLCKDKGFPYEIKVFEGAGHGFFGPSGEDAFVLVRAFFAKHLKGEVEPSAKN
ncbi:hypothetical protein BH23PLA1_BH23PLA1_03020 [soil metagenome]